jgi:hypothetical protein
VLRRVAFREDDVGIDAQGTSVVQTGEPRPGNA